MKDIFGIQANETLTDGSCTGWEHRAYLPWSSASDDQFCVLSEGNRLGCGARKIPVNYRGQRSLSKEVYKLLCPDPKPLNLLKIPRCLSF
jgi:hypothetical protein